MRIVRKEKKNKKQKQIIELKKKTYNKWKVRSKKYSAYPYIVTVSFFRKNVFLSASDLRGRIKLWTNAGSLGFKGSDRTNYLAIITVAASFFKKLLRYGIRDIFLKFNNYKRSRWAIKKAIKRLNLKKYKRKWKTTKFVQQFTFEMIKGKKVKIYYSKNKQNMLKKRWYATQKKLQENYYKRKTLSKLRFFGIWTELHVSFNGCRNKKQRRKRHRRKAKRIYLK